MSSDDRTSQTSDKDERRSEIIWPSIARERESCKCNSTSSDKTNIVDALNVKCKTTIIGDWKTQTYPAISNKRKITDRTCIRTMPEFSEKFTLVQ